MNGTSIDASGADRRTEERHPADGTVQLHFNDPAPHAIEADLMDYSTNGFRVSHHFRSLEAGQIVTFRHQSSAGRARVMWNRIMIHAVETGFYILEPNSISIRSAT